MTQKVMQTAGDELIRDRHEARRTFGMSRLHLVFQAGGMGNEGGRHERVRFG